MIFPLTIAIVTTPFVCYVRWLAVRVFVDAYRDSRRTFHRRLAADSEG